MRLQNPWLLLIEILVGIGAYFFLRKRRTPFLWFPDTGWSRHIYTPLLHRFPRLPQVLIVIAAAIATLALARPQIRGGYSLTGKGADFMIVLDMSVSMNAVDMSPRQIMKYHSLGKEPPNRFKLAVQMIKKFIATRKEDRIGLVIFAKKAYLMFPPTLDYDAIIEILDGLVLDDGRRPNGSADCINGCTINGDATAIGDALAKAYNRLKNSKAKSKNIILITDGANNAGKLQPQTVARYIADQPKDKQARIYSFLVGNPKYTFVPVVDPFTGEFARGPDGLLLYEVPRSPFDVNPKLLKQISQMTHGKFFRTVSASQFRKEFDRLAKTEFKMPKITTYKEAFEPLVLAAFLLILLAGLLEFTFYRRFP